MLLVRTKPIFVAPQIRANNVEAQHFNDINCSSEIGDSGSVTHIAVIGDPENPNAIKPIYLITIKAAAGGNQVEFISINGCTNTAILWAS
jgi:hypothetical protein